MGESGRRVRLFHAKTVSTGMTSLTHEQARGGLLGTVELGVKRIEILIRNWTIW